MTWRLAIRAVYLVQDVRRARPREGGLYGPGLLGRLASGLDARITAESRRSLIRLIRRLDCLACPAAVPPDGTGDHLVAACEGGAPGVENFAPLCPRCNSLKGTTDFLVWWRGSYELAALDLDVMCNWSRQRYQWAARRGCLDEAPPAAIRGAVLALVATLPPPHRPALWAAAQGLTVGVPA